MVGDQVQIDYASDLTGIQNANFEYRSADGN